MCAFWLVASYRIRDTTSHAERSGEAKKWSWEQCAWHDRISLRITFNFMFLNIYAAYVPRIYKHSLNTIAFIHSSVTWQRLYHVSIRCQLANAVARDWSTSVMCEGVRRWRAEQLKCVASNVGGCGNVSCFVLLNKQLGGVGWKQS